MNRGDPAFRCAHAGYSAETPQEPLLVLRGDGWHAPFGASPPFSAHDLVPKTGHHFSGSCVIAGGEFLFWRRGGWQSSGTRNVSRERFLFVGHREA
jgi:hypothetical protein